MADQSSSSSEEFQHKSPTSPPTNVVSVLSKMLQVHIPNQTEEADHQVPQNTKKFGFFLDFPLDNLIPKCDVEVEESMKIQSGLMKALQKFKFALGQKGYDFDTNLQNFTLRLAKKNGKPKTDMPSIDLKQKFIDLKIANAAIQIKNSNCIKLHEQVNKTTSHYSIGSQIVQHPQEKKQQMLAEEQIIARQKKNNCMFSFC